MAERNYKIAVIGALWTGCLMLDHLGEFEASKRLTKAIETVTAKGEVLPHDRGGSASTYEVTQAVTTAIRSANA